MATGTKRASGQGMDLEDLLEKIASCRNDGPQYVIVGGLYLDLRVYPIDQEQLEGLERSTLEPVQAQLGGSAYFMSKYLHDHHQVKPTLVSIVGAQSDPLSQLASTLINQEKDWIDELGLARRELSTPVSVRLENRARTRETIFTHRGALEDFGWNDVTNAVKRLRDCPSIVFVSGYFRTQLHQQLETHLKNLSRTNLIALDPGQWISDDSAPRAREALQNAIQQGFVDLYICSPKELESLAGIDASSASNVRERILQVAETIKLPPLTVVRERTWRSAQAAEAYVVLNGSVHHVVRKPPPAKERHGGPSPKNAFNGAFIHELISAPHDDLEDAAIHAAREAILIWCKHS